MQAKVIHLIFPFDSKIIIVIVMTLILDVIHYYLIGDIPTDTAEVSSRPDVSSPKLLLQHWKILQQLVCRLSFEPLH